MRKAVLALAVVSLVGCGDGSMTGTGGGSGATGGGSGATGGGSGATGGGSGATGGGSGATGGGGGSAGTGGGSASAGGGTASTGGGSGTTGGGSGATGGGTAGSLDGGALSGVTYFGTWNDVAANTLGQFMAVGDDGVVATSSDGRSWALGIVPTRQNVLGVTWFEVTQQWVASGSDGGIFVSSDGQTWRTKELGAGALKDVAAGAGRVVAIGPKRSFYSDDAVGWDAGTGVGTSSTDDMVSLAFGNGIFQAVSSTWRVRKSTDGINFATSTTQPCQFLGGSGDESSFINGRFYVSGFEAVCDMGATSVGSGSSVDIYAEKVVVRALAGTATQLVGFGTGAEWVVGDAGVLRTGRLFHDTTINGLAVANGNWVAVGFDGVMLHSSDGTTWTEVNPSARARDYSRITYGAGRFVASGQGGRSRVMVSGLDGGAWQLGEPWAAVDYANNRFFGHGLEGVYATSDDGLSWSPPRVSLNIANLSRVAYGNGVFVASGHDYRAFPLKNVVLFSTDGGNWVRTDGGVADQSFNAIAFGNGRFVAASQQMNPRTVVTSTDGVAWTAVGVDGGSTSATLSLAFGNGRFVFPTHAPGTARVSSDGFNWDLSPQAPWDFAAPRVYFGPGYFVGVSANAIHLSSDGVTWNVLDGGTKLPAQDPGVYAQGLHTIPMQRNAVVQSPDLFSTRVTALNPGGTVRDVAVSSAGTLLVNSYGSAVRKGPSGLSYGPTGTSGLMKVVRGANVVVGVDGTRTVMVSADEGESWVSANALPPSAVSFFTGGPSTGVFFNSTFLVSGESSALYTSTDGRSWTVSGSGGGYTMMFVGNSEVVACSGSTVSFGTPASFMVAPTSARTQDCLGGAYGNGTYVIVGKQGEVTRSSDARVWVVSRPADASGAPSWNDVTFVDGRFIAVGDDGLVRMSTDGLAWSSVHGPPVKLTRVVPTGAARQVLIAGDKGLSFTLTF